MYESIAAVCDRIKGQVSARSGHTHHISRGKREHAKMSVNLIRDGWGWMDGLLNPYEVHHVYKVRPLGASTALHPAQHAPLSAVA